MQDSNHSNPIAPWQAMTMLALGIAIIFFGLMTLKVNARIVLAVDGAIMCLMACAFGIQKGIKDTIASMLIAMLILLAVGVLIGTWMASGTIPVMVYYGMQVITPALFLPVACILCTLMSTLAGTSWGTLATVGVACMGVRCSMRRRLLRRQDFSSKRLSCHYRNRDRHTAYGGYQALAYLHWSRLFSQPGVLLCLRS